MSFRIFSLLTFVSPILGARLGGVPIDVGGALRRRRRIINDSPATIGDHPDLDSVGLDEVVRFVKAWAPTAAIRVLSRRGGHLYDWRRIGASENR